MHALSSLIAKQKNTHFEDEISQLINIQITKLNEVRKIGNLNLTSKLHFECVIFPAMNNPIYKEKLILNFFQINKKLNLNKKLFNLYVKNFLKNPATFLWSFQQCFFANSMLAEILTQKETDDINKILLNPIFNDNDKRIILLFQDDTKNYKNVITKFRFFNLCLLSISIISFILSIKSIISKKNDKFAILSILFFLMYYLVVNLHVNLVHAQARWFFTYFPLLIFSNLKIIEYINLILFNKILKR